MAALHCDCVESIRECFRDSGSKFAKVSEILFFQTATFHCFKNEYPIVGCNEYRQNEYLGGSICTSYELDETKSKMYQFFDIPGYLIDEDIVSLMWLHRYQTECSFFISNNCKWFEDSNLP